MEKEIINEIRRISELMVLSENTTTNLINWMRRFVQNDGEIIRQTLLKSNDAEIETALKKLVNNKDIDDKLFSKLIRNIEWNEIGKYVIEQKKLGTNFSNDLQEAIKRIYKYPEQKETIIEEFNTKIDSLNYLNDSPLLLKQSIKSELRTKIDDGIRLIEQNADKVYDIIKAKITSTPISAKVWSKLKDQQRLQFETFVKSNIILGKERESIQRMANNWMIKHGTIQFFKSPWGIGTGVLLVFGLYKGYKWITNSISGNDEQSNQSHGASTGNKTYRGIDNNGDPIFN